MAQPKIFQSFRDPDLKRAYLRAIRAGWTSRLGGSGHVILTSPTGQRVVLSKTAVAGRAIKNAVADLRRAGLEI